MDVWHRGWGLDEDECGRGLLLWLAYQRSGVDHFCDQILEGKRGIATVVV